MVEQKQFRIDLFHRLRVIQLDIPPLRERREDIPLLIAHFLEKFDAGHGKKEITNDALMALQQYDWPGNVRELENIIQSLVIMTPGILITESSFPAWLTTPETQSQEQEETPPPPQKIDRGGALPALRDFTRQAEREYIERVLSLHDGDKSATAHALRVGRTTLYSKLKELGLIH